MDTVSLIIGLSNMGTSIPIIALLVPLLRNRIPRNRWYGFRTPTTLSSDEAWFDCNRYCARQMMPWAVTILLLGAACLFLPMQQNPKLAMVAGLAPLGYLIPSIQAWVYSRRYRTAVK